MKVTRALRAGEVERGIRIAQRYRRIARRNPGLYLLEYYATNRMSRVDRGAQLALLRTGWSRGPFHTGLAEALLVELYREDCVRPNPTVRAEARKVIDQIVSLYGDSAWTTLWLSELAQLDGVWVSAKQYVELALNALENGDSRFVKGYLRAGMSLSSIPGEEARGEHLILESTERYEGPLPHIFYALVVEERDPATAQKHLQLARERWRDEAHPFDHEVRITRDFHRANLRRLALLQ